MSQQRKPDRNFAVRPSVQQLREMVAPDAVDVPCDREDCRICYPHDPRCDCDDCMDRAESRQDDLEQAQIHDIDREP